MNHSTSHTFLTKYVLVLWFILFSKHILALDRLKLGESLLDKFLEFIDADGLHWFALQGSDRAAAEVFEHLQLSSSLVDGLGR